MEQIPAQCPFLKQRCIKERCELFTETPVIQGSPLVGMTKAAAIRGCSFVLMVHFLGRLNMIATAGPGRPPGPG